jgi:hypothetical protein
MSTSYYVVCDKCEKSYWAWHRSAGGVNFPPLADDLDAFQQFLSEHLHRGHDLRFVSEDDSRSGDYEECHPTIVERRMAEEALDRDEPQGDVSPGPEPPESR